MNKKEKQEYKEALEVMKTNELVNIIIDQDERLSIYEEKERDNIKQGKWGAI
tara:strand:+ start:495 stop:650 length:156 start_codon:yes stop_codon:yes gene_type:complete